MLRHWLAGKVHGRVSKFKHDFYNNMYTKCEMSKSAGGSCVETHFQQANIGIIGAG